MQWAGMMAAWFGPCSIGGAQALRAATEQGQHDAGSQLAEEPIAARAEHLQRRLR